MNGYTQSIKDYILLYIGIFIYSISLVMNKIASQHSLLSTRFMIFYGASLLTLVIYALLWQQILKRFSLATAYSNRPLAMLFGMVWGRIFFSEKITLSMIFGAAVILAGIRIGAKADEI